MTESRRLIRKESSRSLRIEPIVNGLNSLRHKRQSFRSEQKIQLLGYLHNSLLSDERKKAGVFQQLSYYFSNPDNESFIQNLKQILTDDNDKEYLKTLLNSRNAHIELKCTLRELESFKIALGLIPKPELKPDPKPQSPKLGRTVSAFFHKKPAKTQSNSNEITTNSNQKKVPQAKPRSSSISSNQRPLLIPAQPGEKPQVPKPQPTLKAISAASKPAIEGIESKYLDEFSQLIANYLFEAEKCNLLQRIDLLDDNFTESTIPDDIFSQLVNLLKSNPKSLLLRTNLTTSEETYLISLIRMLEKTQELRMSEANQASRRALTRR